ncbi:MAG: 16S rRNA (guanine(966)-N(2))-methyltransferase RsmD [Deltaproteobacteria bacterium]|nr:16S rRNA (guanine(966)-N(2))-methyltransferase RsmD [Deltaproteobacteria bacterium]
MRVIGGKAKGRYLKVPKGHSLRPTASRVKEALFNILPHDLSGFRVLDLFAGTGNLSIEALSRGAYEAVLVEASDKAGRTIHKNLEALDLSRNVRVLIVPVLRAIRSLSRQGETFDLIFLDPPYEKGWVDRILMAVAHGGLLRKSGIVVAEHSMREKVAVTCAPLRLKDQRRYGTTLLSFFRYEAAGSPEGEGAKQNGANSCGDLSRVF